MSARIHPGIYTHLTLGIKPHSIEVSSSKIPVKMETGFTFAIPEDVKKLLSDAFKKACNLPTTDNDMEGVCRHD